VEEIYDRLMNKHTHTHMPTLILSSLCGKGQRCDFIIFHHLLP